MSTPISNSSSTPRDHYVASGHLYQNTKMLIESILQMYGAKPKSRDIYTDWIKEQSLLLKEESIWRKSIITNSSERNREQKRIFSKHRKEYNVADILYVNLGYNIGHEYGGAHFCIVMKKSERNDPNLIVLPLTSSAPTPGSENERRHFSLGEIPCLNQRADKDNKVSYAKLEELKGISKLRIIEFKGTLDKSLFREMELALHDFLSPFLRKERIEAKNKIEKLELKIELKDQEKISLKEEIESLKEDLLEANDKIKTLSTEANG